MRDHQLVDKLLLSPRPLIHASVILLCSFIKFLFRTKNLTLYQLNTLGETFVLILCRGVDKSSYLTDQVLSVCGSPFAFLPKDQVKARLCGISSNSCGSGSRAELKPKFFSFSLLGNDTFLCVIKYRLEFSTKLTIRVMEL